VKWAKGRYAESDVPFTAADNRLFLKQMGTSCTQHTDFEEVGTLAVTEKAVLQQRYVVGPEEHSSVEVRGVFDFAEVDEHTLTIHDRIMVIDACGTCGVTPPSAHVVLGEHEVPEEFPPLIDYGPAFIVDERSYCEMLPELCEEAQDDCRDRCNIKDPCNDAPVEELEALGIDVADWESQGGCDGAIVGSEDEDGHTCLETFAELQILPTAKQSTTLCDVCCVTCTKHGHACPEPPNVPGADECFDRCMEKKGDDYRKSIMKPVVGRRRRASTESILRFYPVTATLAGRYKVCFCDSSQGPCKSVSAFPFELGPLHASGVSCLLEGGLRSQECAPQDEGGLFCVDE
jgi:hypothetical protein